MREERLRACCRAGQGMVWLWAGTHSPDLFKKVPARMTKTSRTSTSRQMCQGGDTKSSSACGHLSLCSYPGGQLQV